MHVSTESTQPTRTVRSMSSFRTITFRYPSTKMLYLLLSPVVARIQVTPESFAYRDVAVYVRAGK